MDAEALKATLSHLAQTMPVMAQQVSEGIETGHAAQADGAELIKDAATLMDAAEQQLKDAEQAVHEFTEFANQQKSELENIYQQLEAKIHEFADIDPIL